MNESLDKEKARSPFHGVNQIIRFNWPRYAAVPVVLLGIWLLLRSGACPRWMTVPGIMAIAMMLWWTVASLIVSYWVYDASELMRWQWLKRELPSGVNHWLNVHAGLDESTPALQNTWPTATGETVDIFAANEMTEKSIHRARNEGKAPGCSVNYRALPFGPGQFDTVFLFFAVHELRNSASRSAFFGEIHRILEPNGNAMLVEHLRNPINFAAYGPGAFHFHSGRTWRDDSAAAHLMVAREFSLTPFVHIFILRKEP